VKGQDGYSTPVTIEVAWDAQVGGYVATVSLRAERDGSESGRTYSAVCEAVDEQGNPSTASCVVVVPHDRRKK